MKDSGHKNIFICNKNVMKNVLLLEFYWGEYQIFA